MHILVYGMILSGSALMVYNILRYRRFTKEAKRVGNLAENPLVMVVPQALLILFLMGYLGVAFFADPDLLVAMILFGGSIFVFLALRLLYFVLGRVRGNEERLAVLYEEVRGSLDAYRKDALAFFRVNLTRDSIEERGGRDLFEEDAAARTYTRLLESRWKYLVVFPDFVEGGGQGLFTREGLLAEFAAGRTQASEILATRRKSGQICFVHMQASLALQPGTGDVIAFITEHNYNLEMVNDTILTKVLAEQYDMITYLVDGEYGIVVGDASRIRRGNLFPRSRGGSYAAYIRDQVAPVVEGTKEERAALLAALDLGHVERELQKGEPYEVSLACRIDGETCYKRFSFFNVDPGARFYILLKSDTTRAQEDQIRRNRVLEEALAQAQAASAAKTAFLSNMSHDIRTPMNAIIGFNHLARDRMDQILEGLAQVPGPMQGEDARQVRDYLEKIDGSSQHLLDLINDVLEMSRIESGKMELHEAPMDLRAVLDEVREIFALQMEGKKISYRVLEKNLRDPLVYGDQARLNRVLLNLVSNAFKFTPEGGAVEVSLEEEPAYRQAQGERKGQAQAGGPDRTEGGGQPPLASYILRVRDTGIGMSPAFAARVFDAFERERNSTVSGIQGTGLGMAITKKIVDLMGGSIDVETAPGEGTAFTVRLALQVAEAALPERAGRHCGPDEVGNFTGMRLLIVDDMAVNREIAIMVLSQMGFVCESAENGREAVDKVAASPMCTYQGILMDIQMPVMDGYQASRAIRALPHPYPAEIPIIAMSANAFAEDVQASLAAGMDAHVSKPIDIPQLRLTLEKILLPVCEKMRNMHGGESPMAK